MEFKIACSMCGDNLKVVDCYTDSDPLNVNALYISVMPCATCTWNKAIEHYDKFKETLKTAREYADSPVKAEESQE